MDNLDLLVKLELPQYAPTQPKISLESETGHIIETDDKAAPPDVQSLREQVSEKLDFMVQ